jgi:hypothetical protein
VSLVEAAVLWSGAALTLAIFGALFGENRAGRAAEHLFAGVSAAYWMVTAFWSMLVPNLFGRIYPAAVGTLLPGVAESAADLSYVVPLALGVLLVAGARGPRWAGATRLPLACVIGFAAGTGLTRVVESDLIGVLRDAAVPLVAVRAGGDIDWAESLGHAATLACTLAALCYFFFTRPARGALARAAAAGRIVIMIALGALFAHTAATRAQALIDRVEFLASCARGIAR